MTREEAIRCLGVHSSTNGSGLCIDEQHYEAKQMSIKALEQTRWISVNERLPEEGLAVLTYGENGDYEVNWLDFDGKWFWEDVDVVAWMPLPPCYKPQESEE